VANKLDWGSTLKDALEQPEAQAADPNTPAQRPAPLPTTEPEPWKRVQLGTYVRPAVHQALKELAERRSRELGKRITMTDLLDEVLAEYLEKHLA
jgi:hypothetical protein